MIMQLRIWYVIITKNKLAIKSHFLAPCSDTPEAHVTNSVQQLHRHQAECEDHSVTINDNNNVDHLVAHMYVCGLFEAKFLYNWEETANKFWRATQPHFTWQFNKKWRKLDCKNAHKTTKAAPCSAKLPATTPLSPPKEGQPPQWKKTALPHHWNMLQRCRRSSTPRTSASLILR